MAHFLKNNKADLKTTIARQKLISHPLPYSAPHLMTTLFGRMGVSLQRLVMFTGLGGRLGSTPGLFVGIGLGN